MVVQSFYIAEDEGYSTSGSDTKSDPDHIYFHEDEYYEELCDEFNGDCEAELRF
jgi:hypothetical protein